MVLADTGRHPGVATAFVNLEERRRGFGSPDLRLHRRPQTYGRVLQR
jgi:hypothetical protein